MAKNKRSVASLESIIEPIQLAIREEEAEKRAVAAALQLGSLGLTSGAQIELLAREYSMEAVHVLQRVMRNPKAKHTDAIKAATCILERGLGKAVTRTQTQTIKTMPLDQLSDAELFDLLRDTMHERAATLPPAKRATVLAGLKALESMDANDSSSVSVHDATVQLSDTLSGPPTPIEEGVCPGQGGVGDVSGSPPTHKSAAKSKRKVETKRKAKKSGRGK